MSFFRRLTSVVKSKKFINRTDKILAQQSQFSGAEIVKAETEAKNIILSAKDEALKLKTQAEGEIKKLQEQVLSLEQSVNHKEILLSQKLQTLEDRERNLLAKEESYLSKQKEIDDTRKKLIEKLENISKLTREEAKKQIIETIKDEASSEAGKIARGIIDQAKDEAEEKAKEIIVSEMVHAANNYVAEYTVSTVSVPNEEVKGRIIGKEGRNIRAFEQYTGVDIELDEEGVIRLSCFDGVRREIARVALERLIRDSRIQPSRIEEVVMQVRAEIEKIMFDEGEKLAHAVGVFNLRRELIALLGKFKYRFSYGQNMIAHTLEETKLGIALASELGVDVNVVRLGCLLHDIGKIVESEEGSHVTLGASLLRKMGVSEKVVACVEEHHEDKPFSSIESMLVYISDAISGARPGARYEDLEKYIARLKQLEELCKSFHGVVNAWVYQAGREIRIAVEPHVLTDEQTTLLALEVKKKIEEEIRDFPGQIRITVIRELRVQETAK